MKHSPDDPFYNIPDIVTGELRQIRSAVSLVEAKVCDLEKGYRDLKEENTLLREQLLKTTQLVAGYPTANDYSTVRASIERLASTIWQPSASFVADIKRQIVQEMQPLSVGGDAEAATGISFTEQLALELAPINTRLDALAEALEGKAGKRSVTATIKQRFEEISTMIKTLQESLADILSEKADMETVRNEMETKVSKVSLQAILEPYLRADALTALKQDTAAEEGVAERLSRLELRAVAQQQACESAIQIGVAASAAKLQDHIDRLDVLVKANTAAISRACASADTAMADARAMRSDRSAETIASFAQLEKEIKALTGRVSVVEASIMQKVNQTDFQALRRQLQSQTSADRMFTCDNGLCGTTNRTLVGRK